MKPVTMALLCAFLWLCPAPSSAQTAAATDQGAAALYRAGQFEQAVQAYELLLAARPDNPYYLYNLGNSYFKMGRMGKAVLYYRRAFELLPRDPDIRANLSFAMKKAGDELVPAGMPEVLHTLYNYLALKELSGLFWALCWLACLPGAACLWLTRARRYLLAPAIGLAALALLCGGWLLARRETADKAPAVVTASQSEVRTGPGDNFTVVATMPEGHTVDILEAKDNWLQVDVKNSNLKGWVRTDTVEKI